MTHFFDLYFYKSINNTNDKLKEIRLVNPDRNIALFSADQIKGKGRSGRIWISNEGDLTCSFLINQSISFKDIGKINIIFVNILFSLFIHILNKINQYILSRLRHFCVTRLKSFEICFFKL